MIEKDREKQIRECRKRLEDLVLIAEKDRKELEVLDESHEGFEHEIEAAEAYENGAFQAYAIFRQIFEV